VADLHDLRKFTEELPRQDQVMPLLFVGHGNPMNAIEDNEFSQGWRSTAERLPPPAAVLCVSAHWLSEGTLVTAMDQPRTIHDFYGFPEELYSVQYPAPGHPWLARETEHLLRTARVTPDAGWGLDHGCWSVLRAMYPRADVPVIQLSLNLRKPATWHYELGKELATLRSRGVLIIGSGDIVHNLRLVDWEQPDGGFPWAEEMNTTFKDAILHHDHAGLINYPSFGEGAALAIPTPDHYLPLLYVLALQHNGESIEFFNDRIVMGSVSMTSFVVR
jgi:4,5-DOPA dioxygenase extradiol